MPFGSLWIPVLVSAVVTFVASSLVHMVLKYHKADYQGLPGEEAVREALRKANVGPGIYITPYCADMKDMKSPAMLEKWAKGPVALVAMFPNGVPVMPKLLGLWFGFIVFVSFVAAYVARLTLHPGSEGMLVMRITGTVAFVGYGLSHVSDSIWGGKPWSNTARALLDAVIYSVLTGLTFRLLWPTA
jgi:hypothetical protein